MKVFGGGHELSHFNLWVFILDLLETVVGCRKLRSFQGTLVNLSVLLEKPDIKYPTRPS